MHRISLNHCLTLHDEQFRSHWFNDPLDNPRDNPPNRPLNGPLDTPRFASRLT